MFSNKKIFQYFDGAQPVWGDPIGIHRRLTALLDGDPNRVIATSAAGDPVYQDDGQDDGQGNLLLGSQPSAEQRLAGLAATERLLEAVRVAFQMPFDRATGQGATEEECFAALDQFAEYLEAKKPSGENSQTLPPTSVAADSSPTTN